MEKTLSACSQAKGLNRRNWPGGSQDPVIPPRPPMWVIGSQVLAPLSAALPGVLAGNWTGNLKLQPAPTLDASIAQVA